MVVHRDTRMMPIVTLVAFTDLAPAIAILLSIASLAYAWRRAQRAEKRAQRLEERLDRKDRLEELADELKPALTSLRALHHAFCDPLSGSPDEDIMIQSSTLARTIAAHQHLTGEPPRLVLESVSRLGASRSEGSERRELNDEQDALLALQEADLLRCDLRIVNKNEKDIYPVLNNGLIGDQLRVFRFAYISFSNLEEHDELLQEFRPGLLEEGREVTDEIALNCCIKLFKNTGEKDFDLSGLDSTTEVATTILEHYTLYEGIERDLAELDEIISKLDETRTEIVRTSYS